MRKKLIPKSDITDRSGYIGVDSYTILKCLFKKQGFTIKDKFNWLKRGISARIL